MSTHKIGKEGASNSIITAIVEDVYALPRATRNTRPVISILSQKGENHIVVEWRGNIGGLKLNEPAIRKQLEKILLADSEVIVKMQSIRRK